MHIRYGHRGPMGACLRLRRVGGFRSGSWHRGKATLTRRVFVDLTRNRRAAPRFLDPHGGRAGQGPALGALSSNRRTAPRLLDPYAGGLGAARPWGC